MSAYLLVRTGGKPYALPLRGVLEVSDNQQVIPVPGSHPSVRGVTPCRGRLVTRVHLGALMQGDTAPVTGEGTVVMVQAGTESLALEVEDVEAVVREDPLAPPPGFELPLAAGVTRHQGDLVPVLDLAAVLEQLSSAERVGS